MNVSTPENHVPQSGYIPHRENEKEIDLDHLDDLPLQIPTNDRDVVGDFDILRSQLDPDERQEEVQDLSSKSSPTEIFESQSFEGSPDEQIISQIAKARKEKNFNLAYDLASKIENEDSLHSVLKGLVDDLVEEKNFSLAKKFLRLIHNMDVYTEELNHLLDAEKKDASPLDDFGKNNLDSEVTENTVEKSEPENSSLDEFAVSEDPTHQIKIKKIIDTSKVADSADTENPLQVSEVIKEKIISDEDFDNFVKTGEVPGDVLVNIAERIAKGEKISERELAIYETLGEKIELLLRNRKEGNSDDKSPEVELNKNSVNFSANTFDELFDELDSVGEVIGSDGKKYDAESLKSLINLARTIKKTDIIINITRAGGLRQKVVELIQKQEEEEKEKQKIEFGNDAQIPSANDIEMSKKDDVVSEATPESEPELQVVPEVVPPVHAVENKIETIEEIDANLEKARGEYASQMVDWKNKIREKKSKFRKVLQDLGVDKQLPEEEEPVELREARKAYIEAKKAKNKNLVGVIFDVPNQDQRPLGLMQEEMNSKKEELLSMVEKEFEALQQRLTENIPPIEKGVLGKAFDKWRNMNRYQRIAITSGVLAVGGFAFGMSFGAAATYGGYRAGRAVLGTVGAQGAGKVTEAFYDKKNQKTRDAVFEDYTKQINLENFEQKEKDMMAFLDKEKNEKKKQMLKKGLVMAATAGVTNLGMSYSGAMTGGHTGGGSNSTEHIVSDTPKVVSSETLKTPGSLDKVEELKTTVESNISHNPESQIEFTSKGSVEAIHKLKADILGKYVDSGKLIPPILQEQFMNKTPLEIAKTLNFYDKDGASALVMKGESLGVDEDGSVYYEHLNGERQIMIDAKTGAIDDFDGDMIVPKTPEPVFKNSNLYQNEKIGDDVTPVSFKGEPVPEDPFALNRAKVTFTPEVVTENSGLEHVQIPDEEPVIPVNEDTIKLSNVNPNEVVQNTPIVESAPIYHLPTDGGKFVDVFQTGEQKFVSYDGLRIGQEEVFAGKKLLVLDDKYQDGAQYANIRGAFAQAFEKTTNADVIGPYPIAESFEGGKIYVSYNVTDDPNSVKVFLNGKEIATGVTSVVDKNGIPKLTLHSELKGGWLLADNAFERAFKHLNKLIKAKQVVFKM